MIVVIIMLLQKPLDMTCSWSLHILGYEIVDQAGFAAANDKIKMKDNWYRAHTVLTGGR